MPLPNNPLIRDGVSILSPLRYPGSKRRLCGYIAETLRLNSLRPKLFVEPFAGGASVSLQLLNDNVVDRIALGERDPLVASFWKIVFKDSEWLVDQLENLSITVDMWKYFRNNSFRTNRERALACIFLNRTAFSGIMARTTGPIGGYDQQSEYKIDCRFNVPQIIKRIRQAAKLSNRVLFVKNADWNKTFSITQRLSYKPNEIFYYLDPPFYNKADQLYRYYFEDEQHKRLKSVLAKLKSNWLLSYDVAEPIINMYQNNGFEYKHIDIIYSIASSTSIVKAQELIITNLSKVPSETRVWRTTNEWHSSR
jgi:DNA adenine methylase